MDKVVLRNVYGKSVGWVSVQPYRDPKTGQYPPHVRKVNKDGDLILSDEDRKNIGKTHFIASNAEILISDGKTFDLTKPVEAAEWEAIKFNPIIAPSRDGRDSSGHLLIDEGADYDSTLTGRRYGEAEFYVENLEDDLRRSNGKIVKRHKAEAYVLNDTLEHRKKICKLLNKSVNNMIEADIEAYLLQLANDMPDVIIRSYEDNDINLALLLIDAVERSVIRNKNGLFIWADNTILGSSKDAVINWFKAPENQRFFTAIKRETYGMNGSDSDALPEIVTEEKSSKNKKIQIKA